MIYIFIAEIPNCDQPYNGGCEHICTIVDDEIVCDCYLGYILNPSGKECRGDLTDRL